MTVLLTIAALAVGGVLLFVFTTWAVACLLYGWSLRLWWRTFFVDSPPWRRDGW